MQQQDLKNYSVTINNGIEVLKGILLLSCSFNNNPRLEGPELQGLVAYDMNC
jgi:hypothetical protein